MKKLLAWISHHKLLTFLIVWLGIILVCGLTLFIPLAIDKYRYYTICKDEKLVKELHDEACKSYQSVALDLFGFDNLSYGNKIRAAESDKLVVYLVTSPAFMMKSGYEIAFIQYEGQYVGQFLLDTNHWDKHLQFSDDLVLRYSENADKVWFYFDDVGEYRYNFQLFELDKNSKLVLFYNIYPAFQSPDVQADEVLLNVNNKTVNLYLKKNLVRTFSVSNELIYKTYASHTKKQCTLMDFACPAGWQIFNDEAGCGCAKTPEVQW